MLDADSVFERLLREATNLVPKMSTPKLTNAMKVTSALQQKITDTVTSRLQQEKGVQQFSNSNTQQISFASLFPSGLISDATMDCSGEPDMGAQERQTVVAVAIPPDVTNCQSAAATDDTNAIVTCTVAGGDIATGNTTTTTPTTTTTMGDAYSLMPSAQGNGDSCQHHALGSSAEPSTSSPMSMSSTSGPGAGLVLFPLGAGHPTTSSALPSLVVTSAPSPLSSPHDTSICKVVVPGECTFPPPTGNVFLAQSSASNADVDDEAAADQLGTAGSAHSNGSGARESAGYAGAALLDDQVMGEEGASGAEHLSIRLGDTGSGGLTCPLGLKPEPGDTNRLTMLGFKATGGAPVVTTSALGAPHTAGGEHVIGSFGSFPASASTFCPTPGSASFSSPILAQLPVPVASSSTPSDNNSNCTTATVNNNNSTISTISSTTGHDLMLVNVPSSTTTGSSKILSATGPSLSAGSGGGPYRCRDCDKEFRILRYLEKHRRIHTGEKPYQCCYCGRQFNDWPNMNRHKRIHTGERPYRCSVCAKTFSQPAVYNEHVKRHTGERPHICMVCAKGFPRAARLAVHMRVHTGERPYPCNSCDRRFSQPHHLAAHLRVHSGDRPYACSKCHVSFACISNLRRHRKQVHPNSPILSGELPNEATGANNTNTTINNATSSAGGVGAGATGGEVVLTLNDEKKPSLQCLNIGAMTRSTPGGNTLISPKAQQLLGDASAAAGGAGGGGMASLAAAAAAAAMSGSLLGGAALVPTAAGTSIPGLILTPGPQGTLIAAAPGQFATMDHHSGQAQLIATHGTGLTDSSGLLSVATSAGSFSMTAGGPPSDLLFKSVSSIPCSTTLSLVLPTVLSATSNSNAGATGAGGAHAAGPTTVTFLAPPPELTAGGAATGSGATATGASALLHDGSGTVGGAPVVSVSGPAGGGLVVNSASGETVYLEPLDPRLTFDHSQQQFTLTTMPTGHGLGSAGPTSAAAYPLLAATSGGHPLHLQPAAGATHIAFATNAVSSAGSVVGQQPTPAMIGGGGPGAAGTHLLSAAPIFSSSPPLGAGQQHIYTSSGQQPQQQQQLQPQQQQHPTATILFPSQQQQQAQQSNSSQMLHYHHRTAVSGSGASVCGRPSSTPTTTMLVPVLQHPQQQQQAHRTEALGDASMGTTGWPISAAGANFVTLATAAAAVGGNPATVVLSSSEPVGLAGAATSSRPASVLSNLSASPSTGNTSNPTAGGGVAVVPTSSATVVAEGNL